MGEAVEECAVLPPVEEDVQVKGFWRLPAEIRNAIYEELLVTDCAFRLGYVDYVYFHMVCVLIGSITDTTGRTLTRHAN